MKGAPHDQGEGKVEVIDLRGLLARDEDFVRAAVEEKHKKEALRALAA